MTTDTGRERRGALAVTIGVGLWMAACGRDAGPTASTSSSEVNTVGRALACADGEYGEAGGPCTPCSTACAPVGSGPVCDPTTGACLGGCTPGASGLRCDAACSVGCAPCGDGGPACDASGECRCGCTPDTWGAQCDKACAPECPASASAPTAPRCDRAEGGCTSCATSSWGPDCTAPCPVTCPAVASGPTCRRDDGQCVLAFDDCPPGQWGPACEPCNSCCDAGTCDQTTGACTEGCLHACDTWGPQCDQACASTCLDMNALADCSQDGACSFCSGDGCGDQCQTTFDPHCVNDLGDVPSCTCTCQAGFQDASVCTNAGGQPGSTACDGVGAFPVACEPSCRSCLQLEGCVPFFCTQCADCLAEVDACECYIKSECAGLVC